MGKARSALHFFDALKYRLMDQLAESMKSDKEGVYAYDDFSNLKLLARATASLGWSGRSIFQGYQNDYLGVEREGYTNVFKRPFDKSA